MHFFFSPSVLIIACVDTTWVISFRVYVLYRDHMRLSHCSLRLGTAIMLYCIQMTQVLFRDGYLQFKILFLS